VDLGTLCRDRSARRGLPTDGWSLLRALTENEWES
jgi:hypothetical protein